MFQGRSWKLLAAILVSVVAHGAQADQQAVPGEYVVVLKDNNQMGVQSFQSVFRAAGVEAINKKGDQLLVKRSPLEREDFVIADIESNPAVAYAEPNYIYTINAEPNDPMFGDLWGIANIGQKNGKAGVDISATQAWDITTGSRDIIVGVIDTGVDYTHPDLMNNMWKNEAEANGVEGVDDDNNGYVDDIYGYDFANTDADPIDDHNHGTHVAGTIGAEGNDGTGVVGVNWKVRIMALKFLTASGSGSLAGALKAIDYATENGAHLTNNSWGGGGFSQSLYDSIERAKNKGVLFVAAAGNDSKNDNDSRPKYPASYDLDNIISVAAVDRNGELASFSNIGRTSVDVGAPGVEILSTVKGGEYKEYRGTSMASPHVAGIAALVLSEFPDMDYSEVRERIIATAVPMASLKNLCVSGGMANAFAALTNALPPPDLNDPSNWKNVEVFAETAHPYAADTTQEWVFEKEGANRVSVYFERFETENNYDKVQFFNRAGELIHTQSGSYNDTFGPTIDGDYVRVVFTSDNNVNRFGLVMKALAYDDGQ